MNVKDRHAYLIIAHEKEELLRELIRQLDHVDNDNFPINVIANIFADKLMNM